MNGAGTAPGPASVVALGATSCGVVPWRSKGQLRLTVVVKATFDLVPGAPMTQTEPDPIVTVEAHHRNVPTQSVRLTGDLAPFLPAADALLTGHAHAPEGAPAQALTVRFAVFREKALVEKLIHVYGDRAAGGTEIAPFEEMPLVYERAYGGLGSRDNPFGTGVGAHDKAPNLIDPGDPKKPACYAPISAAWPGRKRMLDRAQQDGLKQPIHELVGELDWQFFHAAPADQRIPQYLKGNEWIVLDGMHPTERSVQSRLPDAAGAARVYGLGEADGQDVTMVADTLRVDADRMICSVVWRGHVSVPDEVTLSSLEVVAGVAVGEQSIEWPARLEQEALVEYESLSGTPPEAAPAAPLVMPANAQAGTQAGAQTNLPGAPAHPPAIGVRPAHDGTVEAAPDAPTRKPLPFRPGQAALPPPQPKPRPAPTGTMDATMTVPTEKEGLGQTLPFNKRFALRAPRAGGTGDQAPAPPQGTGGAAAKPPARPVTPGETPGPRGRPLLRPAAPPDHGSTMTISHEDEQAAFVRSSVPFVPPNAPAKAFTPGQPPAAGDAQKPRALEDASPQAPRPSPFAMGLQPAPADEAHSVNAPAAPTFLKRAPRTLLGVAPTPAVTAPVAPRRKPARTAMGIELFPDGPLAIEVVPWGLTPSRDVITVIAKATCDLGPDGAVLRQAADPPAGEARTGPPERCVYPSDLVPYKVRADVVLVGHAVAQEGLATSMEVSFRFGSKENGFVRRILVFGDRRWQKVKVGTEPTAPEPFARMALAFDRAFGGPHFTENPAGVGHHDPMHRGPVMLPNLENPDRLLRSPRQSPPPAVLAPVPLAWKDRWAVAHASGLCLADQGLDWARFQAAPAPQQLAFLRGDEAFAMAGLSARHPTLEGALPGIAARCFATSPRSASPVRFEEIPLRLDTVVFDMDAMKIDLVWRGALPVADELAPDVQGLYLLADKLGAETPFADARVKVLRP